jgi:hypothetical protein
VRNVPEGNHLSWIARILPELDEGARHRSMDATVGAYHQRNNTVRQSIIPLLLCPSSSATNSPVSNYAGVHHHKEAPIDVDNTGVLFLNSRIAFEDIVDGSAYTIAIGEKVVDGQEDLGWMSGTAATLRNPGNGFTGTAPAGAAGAAWDDPPPWYNQSIVAPSQGDDANNSREDEVDEAKANPFIKTGGAPKAPLAVGGFGSPHAGVVLFAYCDGSVRGNGSMTSPAVFTQLANRKDRQMIEELFQ